MILKMKNRNRIRCSTRDMIVYSTWKPVTAGVSNSVSQEDSMINDFIGCFDASWDSTYDAIRSITHYALKKELEK